MANVPHVLKRIQDLQKRYHQASVGKTIIHLTDYAKQEKLSHSNLLNKANRQTIEAFGDRGKWKIGV